MLALPWRKYSTHDFTINGQRIHIVETPNDSRGTGLIVWDGAFVLGKFLEERYSKREKGMEGLCVIELGCGTGLSGLSAAALGASPVFLTDLEYVLANLQANVDANAILANRVKLAELDWFNPKFEFLQNLKPDVLLLADVAWVPELIPPLVDTLRQICKICESRQPEIFLAHQTRARRSDQLLFDEIEAAGLNAIEVGPDEYAAGFSCVQVFQLSVKQQ